MKGRGFPARVLLFKAFGKDGWTNDTLEFPAWAALKPTTPLGSLRVVFWQCYAVVTCTGTKLTFFVQI